MISCKNKSEAEKVLDDLENRIDEMQKVLKLPNKIIMNVSKSLTMPKLL